VQLKGDASEEALLCTRDKTYQVRFVEYSNALLLCEPRAEGTACQVSGQVDGYFELKETRPKVIQIQQVLASHLYAGPDSEEGGIPLWQLESRVQASSSEIQAELDLLGAMQANGRVWMLDPLYYTDMTDSLVDLILEHDWPVNAVPVEEYLAAMTDVDPNFTETAKKHCLKLLSGPATPETPAGTTALDKLKVGRFKAKQLLHDASGRQWQLDEFLETWKASVPMQLEPELDMLKGMALVETVGTTQSLRPLDAEGLPRDAATRFKKLFAIREKWTREDIVPFLSQVLEPGETEDKLLMKHTRVIQPVQGKPKMYCLK